MRGDEAKRLTWTSSSLILEFGSMVKCVDYDDGVVGIELATESQERT